MAVECEVDACGIDAIGRCRESSCARPGGAAFCFSHNYAGRCRLCLDADKRRMENTDTAIEAARASLRRLASSLMAAGAFPDQRFAQGMTTREVRAGLFGSRTRTETVRDPTRDRYGWLLGSYPWRVKDRESEHSVRLPTYLTTDGSLAPEGGEAAAIDDGSRYAFMRGEEEIRFWEGIASAAAGVAARHGVR
jgi:hypothetical protein